MAITTTSSLDGLFKSVYGDELVERMRALAAHVDKRVEHLHGTSGPSEASV